MTIHKIQAAFFSRFLGFVHPGEISSSRLRHLSIFAKISSALAVQTNAVGSAFHCAMKSKLAWIKSGTLAKLPRRTALPLSSANQRSTMLSQLELVGM